LKAVAFGLLLLLAHIHGLASYWLFFTKLDKLLIPRVEKILLEATSVDLNDVVEFNLAGILVVLGEIFLFEWIILDSKLVDEVVVLNLCVLCNCCVNVSGRFDAFVAGFLGTSFVVIKFSFILGFSLKLYSSQFVSLSSILFFSFVFVRIIFSLN